MLWPRRAARGTWRYSPTGRTSTGFWQTVPEPAVAKLHVAAVGAAAAGLGAAVTAVRRPDHAQQQHGEGRGCRQYPAGWPSRLLTPTDQASTRRPARGVDGCRPCIPAASQPPCRHETPPVHDDSSLGCGRTPPAKAGTSTWMMGTNATKIARIGIDAFRATTNGAWRPAEGTWQKSGRSPVEDRPPGGALRTPGPAGKPKQPRLPLTAKPYAAAHSMPRLRDARPSVPGSRTEKVLADGSAPGLGRRVVPRDPRELRRPRRMKRLGHVSGGARRNSRKTGSGASSLAR